MDPIDDILGAMRVTSSMYVRLRAHGSWGIEFGSKAQARLVVITRGACLLESGEVSGQVALAAGDAFIVQAGVAFTLRDQPGRDVIDCETVFENVAGNAAEYGTEGPLTEVVSGRFSFDVSAAEPLMPLLPGLLQIRLDDKHAHLLRTTLQLMALETSEDGLGSSAIIGRLADVLFMQTLRAWCAAEGETRIGWLGALRDPYLSKAMRAVHANLGRPWTVADMASEAGMSRSAFSAAFRSATDDTPLSYVTHWRMYRTKLLLRDPQRSLLDIALEVGYDTDTALSRAFKRAEGIPPGAWRRTYLATDHDPVAGVAASPSDERKHPHRAHPMAA
jgi:AraC-like DNA-binding protein